MSGNTGPGAVIYSSYQRYLRRGTMNETANTPQRPLELHYFRIPRERWELMLIRLRQMGADAVSSVIPWAWHEPRAGVFDFTGVTHPARDVSDFVATCAAMGLPVILRVSPYIAGAGLLAGGVPGWLLSEQPALCALGPDLQPRRDPASGSPLPSAEHPAYLKSVERWYRELADALSTQQAPSGPIVALRVDGGPASASSRPPAEQPPAWDYNPHVVGAQWPVWLRQQYAGIDALNAAWGTVYHTFGEADFPRPTPAGAGESSRRHDDAARFVAYAADHARQTYARLLADLGWSVPILAAPDEVQVKHAVQVDPEPPEVGTAVRWAQDAPLRADGYPGRRFWSIKAAWWELRDGIKHVEGATLVSGPESRGVRLRRPKGDYAAYRLLLDGRLLDTPCRLRGDTPYLDYAAADEAGETDLVFVCGGPAASLPALLRDYLAALLAGQARILQRTADMGQALAEALSSAATLVGDTPAHAIEDLQAAERGLAEARLAARRAAASLGKLEQVAGDIRGETTSSYPSLIRLAGFSPQEMERLSTVRDACAQVCPALAEAARAITTASQAGQAGLTVQAYRAAYEQGQAAALQADASLSRALARLRADLAAGALSAAARPVHDWLTRMLQGLGAVRAANAE
jgi:hypothetical protein